MNFLGSFNRFVIDKKEKTQKYLLNSKNLRTFALAKVWTYKTNITI